MLSLEKSSPFLQDTGPCQILSSFSDDFLCDGGTEADLSLAVEMIEAEERHTCDNKSTSPMYNNDVDLSDLVDIISQSYKKFPLSHDLPIGDTLLGSDDLLETNDFLSDMGSDDILSDSYSSCDLSEIVPVVTADKIRPQVKRTPEEECPSKRYPHILSTLQGTYKGLSQINMITSPPLPRVKHRYTPVIPNTHSLGVIPSITQNVTPVARPVSKPVTIHQNIPLTQHLPVTPQSTSVKVSVPMSNLKSVPSTQVTRVINVSHPITRICSPVSLHQTIHVPQASVPSLPPPIAEQRRYIVVPQSRKTHPIQHKIVQLSQHLNLNKTNSMVAVTQQSRVPTPPIVVENRPMPVQTPSPVSNGLFPTSMDEDECLSIPKTVCTKENSEPLLPLVVQEEGNKVCHSDSSDTEVDLIRKGRRRTSNKVATQRCRLKKREHFQDLRVEIQDWECSNTRLRYEIYQLQKQIQEMTEQFQKHDCHIGKTKVEQHPPVFHRPLQPSNITSQPVMTKVKIEREPCTSENITPTPPGDLESSGKKRRSKRKRRVSSRILI